MTNRRHIKVLFVYALALSLAAWALVASRSKTTYHGDEGQWISMSECWYALIHGDFYHGCWLAASIDQPVFVPYVFGVVAWCSGYDVGGLNKMYDFQRSYEENVADGRVPPAKLLNRCRWASTIFGILACAAAMLIVGRLTGALGGAAAAVLLATNPLFSRSVNRAMAEGMLCFWLLMGWWLMARWASGAWQKRPQTWGRAALVGIAAGFATMTKLNGGIIALAAVGMAVVLAVAAWRAGGERNAIERAGRPWLMGLLICAVAYVVFIAQSPATWRDPIDAPVAMLEWRAELSARQADAYPSSAIHTQRERLSLVTHHVGQDYGTLGRMGTQAQSIYLDAIVLGLGLLGLSVRAIRSLLSVFRIGRVNRTETTSTCGWTDGVLAIIFVAMLMGPIVAALPLDWDRYYLPAVLASTMLQAWLIGRIGQWVCSRFAKRAEPVAVLPASAS